MKELVIRFEAPFSQVPDYQYDNPDKYEIWILGVASGNKDIRRYDKVFDLHCPEEIKGVFGSPERWTKLQKDPHQKVVAFPPIKNNKLKNSIEYPFESIIEKYGRYLTNSLVLMLLYGYEQGFRTFHIYGISWGTAREVAIESRCCEYWIGFLRGRGCTINTYDFEFCKADFVYGYEDKTIQLEIERLKKRREFLKKELSYVIKNNKTIFVQELENKIDEIDYLLSRT